MAADAQVKSVNPNSCGSHVREFKSSTDNGSTGSKGAVNSDGSNVMESIERKLEPLEIKVASEPVAALKAVTQRYATSSRLTTSDLEIPSHKMIGLIGPDGVGKSTLLGMIAGVRRIQTGKVQVLGGNIADARFRNAVFARVAYLPQGLGKNLYPTLSIFENIDFFGRLFGQSREEREWRIEDLLASTDLTPFRDRPAGKLSGGMKQKLGLCCSLIHDPDLLILDEPTTGVDPLARRQFWELIDRIRVRRPTMSVLVATAYMDEAEGFDWLVAMNAGKVLAHRNSRRSQAQRTDETTLEKAFIKLLPEEARRGHKEPEITPWQSERRSAGDRGARADAEIRGVHRRRSRQFPHRARRDLRISRLQRLRQDHHDEDADRAAAADRRDGAAVREAGQGRRRGVAPARRLHDPGVLALYRADGAAEPAAARAPLRYAADEAAHKRVDELLTTSGWRRSPTPWPRACRSASASGSRWRSR